MLKRKIIQKGHKVYVLVILVEGAHVNNQGRALVLKNRILIIAYTVRCMDTFLRDITKSMAIHQGITHINTWRRNNDFEIPVKRANLVQTKDQYA